ncbi:1-acyl-sn-glycerol-3-phosphate acyltransferase alpha-like [Coccinella septempunctata]|uniref:1-acyl-sn-glycerol-3-phosphate acyltransferase alpha-like n=1 Tax=Coccinella septempunctata TaxID=41139 RepID=UPI001D08AF3F|nr:1-acyl-sn-glycerol-3-phosphate acyltransferase alpha-like [Coccinella septempunctata]
MVESYLKIFLTSCLLILPLLYKTSHVFRYYAKFSIYILFCTINAVYLTPFFCLRPRHIRNFLIASRLCSPVRLLLGVKYELRNTHYIAKDEAFIVVSNHQSILDVLGMFHMWPIMQKCTVIARKEVFYVWPFGLGAWLAGLVFIPRTDVEKSKEIMTETCQMIKDKKAKLWIYPEGKRYSDGQIHPFKKGAFHLAISAQLPILPVVFNQYTFLNHEKKSFDQGTVIMTVLPPIPTCGKTLDDLDSILNETHQKMSTTFHEINKECEKSKKF